MNLEDTLRRDLHAVTHHHLTPEPALADLVLGRARRRRRSSMVAAGLLAVVVAGAVAVPVLTQMGPRPAAVASPGRSAGPTEVTTGPFGSVLYYQTTVGFTIEGNVLAQGDSVQYLADRGSGRYRKVPYEMTFSPDRKMAGIRLHRPGSPSRVGIVGVDALRKRGDQAIRWLPIPLTTDDVVDGPAWSPDGRSYLVSLSGADTLVVYRWDGDAKTPSRITVPRALEPRGVGWAPDSNRYVLLTKSHQGSGGPMLYLNPDGTPGGTFAPAGGGFPTADPYSPDGTKLVIERADGRGRPTTSIVDIRTGVTSGVLPAAGSPIGWYDNATVALVDPENGQVELMTTSGASVAAVKLVLPDKTYMTDAVLGPAGSGMTLKR